MGLTAGLAKCSQDMHVRKQSVSYLRKKAEVKHLCYAGTNTNAHALMVQPSSCYIKTQGDENCSQHYFFTRLRKWLSSK